MSASSPGPDATAADDLEPLPERMRALLVERNAKGATTWGVVELPLERLPPGEVLIRVAWSGLNYKDALSAAGHPGVTRNFPHVPGVDAAGQVVRSTSPAWQPGANVIVTGHDLGQNTWGGFAEFVRVPAAWLVPVPVGLSLRESMIFGTAGLTAGLCVRALAERGVTPGAGPIVVSGASGGVGSLAVGILARAGYEVHAATGKPGARELLRRWGAAAVLERGELVDASPRPLLAARWAGAIDAVGGPTLATLVRSMQYGGVVAACGLVGGADLSTTVYPFILRGVQLVGIDSVACPRPVRDEIWSRLAGPWRVAQLDERATAARLEDLPSWLERILAGGVTGRVIVSPD